MVIQICTKFSIMQTNVCRVLYPQIVTVENTSAVSTRPFSPSRPKWECRWAFYEYTNDSR